LERRSGAGLGRLVAEFEKLTDPEDPDALAVRANQSVRRLADGLSGLDELESIERLYLRRFGPVRPSTAVITLNRANGLAVEGNLQASREALRLLVAAKSLQPWSADPATFVARSRYELLGSAGDSQGLAMEDFGNLPRRSKPPQDSGFWIPMPLRASQKVK
jgi:hypothetical protein